MPHGAMPWRREGEHASWQWRKNAFQVSSNKISKTVTAFKKIEALSLVAEVAQRTLAVDGVAGTLGTRECSLPPSPAACFIPHTQLSLGQEF